MTATSSPSSEYLTAPNRVVSPANGIDYAYRQVGEGTPALVLLQHFRGNLDNWDPALVDALARDRRVVTFDNAGVGGSTGTTPSTIAQMARDAITFLEALELGAVDLLGFSIGSFVAQEIALIRPARGPSRGPRVGSAARRRRDARLGTRGDRSRRRARAQPRRDTSTSSSRARPRAGKRAWRPCGRLTPGATTGTSRRPGRPGRLSTTPCATWGIPDHGQLQRVSAIEHARVRGQRRQRPDDPAALLLPARRPDPAGAGEDLPGRGARVPVPAPRRIRRATSTPSSRRDKKPLSGG